MRRGERERERERESEHAINTITVNGNAVNFDLGHKSFVVFVGWQRDGAADAQQAEALFLANERLRWRDVTPRSSACAHLFLLLPQFFEAAEKRPTEVLFIDCESVS